MSELLIELRQLNQNTIVTSDGDYSVTLDEPVQINQNDEVLIKSVYIDTVSQASGRINIPKEHEELTFNIGLYLKDQDSTREKSADMKTYFASDANDATKAGNTRPNGLEYVLASRTDHNAGNTVTLFKLEGVVVEDKSNNKRFITDEYKRLYLQYVDVTGIIQSLEFEVREKEWRKKKIKAGSTFTFTNSSITYVSAPKFPILIKKDGFGAGSHLRVNPSHMGKEGTGPQYANNSKWDLESSNTGVPTGTVELQTQGNPVYQPWIFPVTVNIPFLEGGYDPQDFARILTDKLTNSNVTNPILAAKGIQENLTLQTSLQLKARGSTPDANNPNINTNPSWVRAKDGADVLEIVSANDYFVGSSAFAFNYDPEKGIFSLDSIHSANYDGSDQAIYPMNHNGINFMINKTGGIFIDSCSMPELLTDQMKFSPSIFTKPTNVLTDITIGDGEQVLANVNTFTYLFEEGVNVTGQAVTLDGYISKGSDPSNNQATYDVVNPFQAQTALPGTQPVGIISTDQYKIYASKDTSAALNDQAYFQVEIGSNFRLQKMSNENTSNKISAIVSKYYSTDNYTTGDSSMAMTYVHQSPEPIMLKDFSVRILNPDGTQSDDKTIQSDNTVFLQILRQK